MKLRKQSFPIFLTLPKSKLVLHGEIFKIKKNENHFQVFNLFGDKVKTFLKVDQPLRSRLAG